MDQVAFAWTLAATFIAGIQLFFQRMVAKEGLISAFNGFLMYGISGAISFVVLPFFGGVPNEWREIVLLGLASGALHGVGNFVRIEALKYVDSVIYFPINKVLGPLLVVIGGILLFSDDLTLRQFVGIGLGLSVPLLLISAGEHHRQNDFHRGMVFVVLSTFFTAMSTLVVKQGLLHDNTVFFMLGMSQLAGLLSSALIFVHQHGARRKSLHVISARDIELGILAGVLGFVAAYTLFKALSLGLVSLVYVIHAHYILIPILLSVWWYGDHINMRKAFAVGVSFLAIGALYAN